MRTIAIALLATTTLVGPTFAADLIIDNTYVAPIVEHTYDWSGFYLGVHGGYGAAHMDGIFDSGEGDSDFFASADDLNLQGGLYGLHAGFNVHDGNLVYGIEGDVSHLGWSDMTLDGDGVPGDELEADLHMLATLRGRFGYAMDNFLFFTTAGVSHVSGTWTVTDEDLGTEEVGSTGFHALGLVVGAGAEVGLTENISLRGEALYHQFGGSFDTSDLTFDSDDGDFGAVDNVFEARAGVSFRF